MGSCEKKLTVNIMSKSEISELRSEVVRLRDQMETFAKPMNDTEKAYWDADRQWREKSWDLFVAEHPDLNQLSIEAKEYERKAHHLLKEFNEKVKERGVSLPSGFWDK